MGNCILQGGVCLLVKKFKSCLSDGFEDEGKVRKESLLKLGLLQNCNLEE